MEGLEFVQHAVGSVEGSKLDLMAVALTLLKIGDPLLSPHLDMIVQSGAVFVVSYCGANSSPSPVEISFGSAECASSCFQLALEGLDPRLGCVS